MKKRFLAFQIIIAVLLICTSVYGALSTTIDLTQSANTVKRGDKVTVTLSLNGVDPNKRIMSVSGYINYNKNVVEDITVNNIQKDSNGKVRIGSEELSVEDLTNATIDNIPSTNAYIGFNGNPTSNNDVRLVIDFNNGITADTDLLKIDFNVKSNATLGEIENAISYSMFVVSSDTEQSEEITKNVNLTVQAVPSGDNNINNTNTNSNTNQNVNYNNTNTNRNNTNTNTNTNRNNTNTNNYNNTNTNRNNTNVNTNTNSNTNTNTNKNNTNSNIVNNTNNSKNNNTNKNGTNTGTNSKDNTTAGSTLPKTGARLLILPIIGVLVLSYISYRKYKQYKNI